MPGGFVVVWTATGVGLLLGGTWFLGPSIVVDAVNRVWPVTTFNRVRSSARHAHVEWVDDDRTIATYLCRLAGKGPWDAVIDASPSTLMAARRIRGWTQPAGA